MAAVTFACPNCKTEIETNESFIGGKAQCPGCNSTVLIPMPGINPGMTIGGFVIERQLGIGGMGEVWLAVHKAMDRKVALKILSPALTGDSDFVTRFMAEVKVSAKLEHPNIVTAYDAGSEDGTYYLAMTYVNGKELDSKLKSDKVIDEREALRIIRSIAEALKYAWDEFKILHRDIKPSNIMLDARGNAKLMDMGISKSMCENKGLTMTGMIVGTPYYMSPEQARAETELDSRSDIYALGTTLYHLVTGEVPYEASTAMGILTRHITEPFPPPQLKNPALSDECSVLLEVMMAKKAEERQQDWSAVISDIDRVLSSKFPLTPRPQAGMSQVMQMTGSQVLAKREITDLPKKAKKICGPQKTDEQEKNTGTKSNIPLIIGISLVVICLICIISFWERNGNHNGSEKVKENIEMRISDNSKPAVDNNKSVELEEMWQYAVNYARTNPKNVKQILTNYEKIKKAGEGSKYELMASTEIAKLKKRPKPGKQKFRKVAEKQKRAQIKTHVRDLNCSRKVKSIELELMAIETGMFKRGVHDITLTKPFWIGKYEVTQEQYEKVMGKNPSTCKKSGKTAPVECVSWTEANEFCKKLTDMERKNLPEGYQFRLPTEAEWEYCCRAGTETKYYFGDSGDDLYKYGNYKDNSSDLDDKDKDHDDGFEQTSPVGYFKPNPWGIYDTHGNVWEWCFDWYANYPGKSVSDPTGPEDGGKRVLRGGSWYATVEDCQSGFRHSNSPDYRFYGIGFRLVLAPVIDTGNRKEAKTDAAWDSSL